MTSTLGINGEIPLVIRKATRSDVQAIWDVRIAAIRAQCRGFYSAEILDAWTSGDPTEQFALWVVSSFYVAVHDDRVLGSGAIDMESGQIDAIFVLPDLMGKGIGSQLLACLEDMAIAAGLNLVVLDATLNAAPFYRKCGYEGNFVGVYQSPRGFNLDCVPMNKALGRSTVDAQPCGQPRSLRSLDAAR